MRCATRDELRLSLSMEAGRHKLLALRLEQEDSDDPDLRDRLLRHYEREDYFRSEIERLCACSEEQVGAFLSKYRHRWLTYALLGTV